MTRRPERPVGAARRHIAPIYGAGFVTAFGAHAVAASLGGYALGHHDSLWELGVLLGIYDGAEVLLKPVFGAVVDRKGAKPVMVGGLLAFAVASLLFVGGYRLLFAVLAVIAAVAAVVAAWFVPHIPPAPKVRSTVVDLMSQILRPEFLRPVLVLGAATAALSAGVGFLPVLGARHGLGPLATGALVSLLAASAALLQPYSGRRMDAGRIHPKTASLALTACAAGFVLAASFSSIAVVAIAAVLIGAGVAVATPLGFTLLARSAPAERMGRTMGAAEVGRELGDAGGPVLVGAFSMISLTAGLGALALALLACAGLVQPRTGRPVPDRA